MLHCVTFAPGIEEDDQLDVLIQHTHHPSIIHSQQQVIPTVTTPTNHSPQSAGPSGDLLSNTDICWHQQLQRDRVPTGIGESLHVKGGAVEDILGHQLENGPGHHFST